MDTIKSRIVVSHTILHMQNKLIPCETGKLDNLTLCAINQANEEMKEVKERWEKNTDDHNQYSVAVGVEKLLSFLIPASECIELVCLEFFGGEKKGRRWSDE